MTNALRFDYQQWKAKDRWRSDNAHFQEGPPSVLLSVFPITTTHTLNINRNDYIPSDLRDLEDQKSWIFVDTHFHEGARSVSLSVFPIKADNTLIINRNDHIALELSDIQDQKLLTLH